MKIEGQEKAFCLFPCVGEVTVFRWPRDEGGVGQRCKWKVKTKPMVYIHIIIIMGEEPTSALVDSKLFVTNAGW